jgi:hypothetical protein
MNRLWCLALVVAAPLAGCGAPGDDEKMAEELNVNSRYIIETVRVSGNTLAANMSDPLRVDLDKVVGSKFDDSLLKNLADRIKKELRVTDVRVNVTRGTEPDHVIVNFEIRERGFDMLVGKFVFDSRGGWTGDGSATTTVNGNSFTFGLLSDGDSLIERYSGVRAIFERKNVGTNRLRVRFEFDDYHEQWNPATLVEASPADIYRSRMVFTPEATVVLFQPLEWSFGVSFARLSVPASVQAEGIGNIGTRTESSNAIVNTLRYHRRWGSERDEQEQELNASYSVQYSTNLFDTDDVYSRNLGNARYRFRHEHNNVEIGFLAGEISGNAPLFERFVLGNSTTLRGWSKFDLDPLGGTHIIHGSIDYRYRFFQAFYDTGAIWDRPEERSQKQSVGTGIKVETFQLAVAFPIRSGRAEPIFYAGLNF